MFNVLTRGPQEFYVIKTELTRFGSNPSIPLLGDRLAVGLRTLTPPTQVRILVPQPFLFPDILTEN
jgi:hypothetical protein